jgi:hypothetical protein
MLTALLAAGSVASAASAQGPDGAWLDRLGRYTMLELGGAQPSPLKPGQRSVSDIVGLFKEACVTRPFGVDQPGSVAEARSWGFKRLDLTVPAGATPAELTGWQAEDVSVRSSNGVFFAPNPQCNVTAALAAPVDPEALEQAVTQALGSAPANADKKLGKKGERRRGYEPVWKVSGPGGVERTIYARAMRGGTGTRLHLGAMEPKEKKK